jgi:uncharacterized protein
MSIVVRHNTEAEIAAIEALCDRLAGFGSDVALEWVDGYLAALAASRRVIGPEEWLPAMFGEAFERAFADPQDVAQATATLNARWQALRTQLDAESLLDEPEALRLLPMMVPCDDAMRAEAVSAGHMTAQEAADLLQTGALWAEGFFAAVEAFADDWPAPEADSEDAEWYDDCCVRVSALTLPQDELAAYLADQYPGETLDRDQLVDEACFAVQDLRIYWTDHAPKPETRRVGATPGRNDPCPCGSGRKYKKCCGATA